MHWFFVFTISALHGDKAHEVLHHLAADDEAHNRRDKGVRAGNRAADGTLALGTRRADAVVFAADGVILDGSHDRLPGVNDFQVLDAALAALGAHDLGQRADGSLINIRDLEAGRVHLVACTHGADDGDASLLALHDQRNFTGDSVDGVHHVVELAEIEAVLRLGAKEGLVGGDLDVGVDVVDALFGHIHLEPAHRLVGGDDLWVITSSLHSLLDTDKLFLADLFEKKADAECPKTSCLDEVLFDLVDNVSILHQELCFNDKDNLMDNLEFVISSFALFVDYLTEEYNITLDNIIENNMIKLGNRYTEDGQRTDGK